MDEKAEGGAFSNHLCRRYSDFVPHSPPAEITFDVQV